MSPASRTLIELWISTSLLRDAEPCRRELGQDCRQLRRKGAGGMGGAGGAGGCVYSAARAWRYRYTYVAATSSRQPAQNFLRSNDCLATSSYFRQVGTLPHPHHSAFSALRRVASLASLYLCARSLHAARAILCQKMEICFACRQAHLHYNISTVFARVIDGCYHVC